MVCAPNFVFVCLFKSSSVIILYLCVFKPICIPSLYLCVSSNLFVLPVLYLCVFQLNLCVLLRCGKFSGLVQKIPAETVKIRNGKGCKKSIES